MIAQRGSVQPDVRSQVGYHAPLELGIPQCALKISLDYRHWTQVFGNLLKIDPCFYVLVAFKPTKNKSKISETLHYLSKPWSQFC